VDAGAQEGVDEGGAQEPAVRRGRSRGRGRHVSHGRWWRSG
jgi:hypothetical protein